MTENATITIETNGHTRRYTLTNMLVHTSTPHGVPHLRVTGDMIDQEDA